MSFDELDKELILFLGNNSFDEQGQPQGININKINLNIEDSELQKRLNIFKNKSVITAIAIEDGTLLYPKLTAYGYNVFQSLSKNKSEHIIYKDENISVLQSDFKGYSKITDLKQRQHLSGFFDNFQKSFLNSNNSILLSKTAGDSLLVYSKSIVDLAAISLKLRDSVRIENWKRFGFIDNMVIRIAIHFGEVRIKYVNGLIKDGIGPSVDTVARIEPIVDDNCVYCTEEFFVLLHEQQSLNIKGTFIGERELPKKYGSLKLYRLNWEFE